MALCLPTRRRRKRDRGRIQQDDSEDTGGCHRAVQSACGDTTIWQGEKLMDKRKAKRLQSAGWKVGSVKEFLGLSDAESAIIELKLELAGAVKEHRCRRAMTQQQLGKLLGSSQSRIAKMEAGDASVSIDLMVRSLLRMGATRNDVAACIATPSRRRAA